MEAVRDIAGRDSYIGHATRGFGKRDDTHFPDQRHELVSIFWHSENSDNNSHKSSSSRKEAGK